jgi:two-component system response regulator AtoC
VRSKILVIDDDRSICETLELYLTEEGYEVVTAATGTEGLNKFVEISPDVVILDIRLPDVDGFTVLEDLREDDENVKVIMITAHHDMDSTINAMKNGAFDYIHKPVNVDELDMAIRKAVKSLEMEKKIDGLLMEPSRHFKVGDIIGGGKEMREIFKMIGTVSQSRTTVLIQGESGTGKELIAKVIHHNTSPDEPYIAVNCSAIVETLLESELFGHEKGSFTGAISRKLGKFELARYGSVFLDEISEMSVNLQAKLLRILQEMEFERVGGKDRIRVHARIIAATNKDLKTLVKEGKFRDDLYYRLNIVAITIPSLRARTDDIPALVDYLLAKINIDLHKRIVGVSDEMMDLSQLPVAGKHPGVGEPPCPGGRRGQGADPHPGRFSRTGGGTRTGSGSTGGDCGEERGWTPPYARQHRGAVYPEGDPGEREEQGRDLRNSRYLPPDLRTEAGEIRNRI